MTEWCLDMKEDPYDWSKRKIEFLVDKINPIKDDKMKTSPGQIWSIKKLLVLDYCIQGFVVIFRKYFEKWVYVDTHCGTGLIGFEEEDLKDERFPGSPLIATFNSNDHQFTDYYFCDEDFESISALNTRLDTLKPILGSKNFNVIQRDFSATVLNLESRSHHNEGYFVFVDPQGFSEIKWNLMERLLKIRTADIFLTFMTPFIAMNRTNAENNESHAQTMTEFYGDNEWSQCNGTDELLEAYIKKIKKYKKNVFNIPVFRQGEIRLYDIIIATNSNGAGNIVLDAQKIMDVTTTELITNALKVVTNKADDLTKWF